jgi:membrane protein DedA with SNARE-associated domain
MTRKVWIWISVLAFLGYAIAGKGAIENGLQELTGLVVGAVLGLLIGLALQRYDDHRRRRPM